MTKKNKCLLTFILSEEYLLKLYRFFFCTFSRKIVLHMPIPPNIISSCVRISLITELGGFFHVLARRFIQMPGQNSHKASFLDIMVKRHKFDYSSSQSKMVNLGVNTRSVGSLKIHGQMPLLVTGAFNDAKLWHIGPNLELSCVAAFEGDNTSNLTAVAIHPKKPIMATVAVGNYPTVNLYQILDRYTPKHLTSLTCFATNDVSSITFSENGEMVSFSTIDGTVNVFQILLEPLKVKHVLTIHLDVCVFGIVFHPILPIIAIYSRSGTMQLWKLKTRTSPASCVAKWEAHRDGWIISCVFSHLGDIILTGSSDETIKVWHMQQKQDGGIDVFFVATLNGHGGAVNSVAFHPSLPSIFVSASMDCTARVWRLLPDFSSATCILKLVGDDNMSCAGFLPDGCGLITGSSNSEMRLWK